MTTTTKALSIRRINLLQSNVHLLVAGQQRMLVDVGGEGTYSLLARQLRRMGVHQGDIDVALITHAHPDHAGAAARVRDEWQVPIAIHEAEVGWLTEGQCELYEPCGMFGRLLNHTLSPEFTPVEPDLVVTDGDESLSRELQLRVVHTPGHTPGSTCLVHSGGDAFVGDLLGGGVLREDKPRGPFFVQDRQRLHESIDRLMAVGTVRLHFGHGRSASAESVRSRTRPWV